MSLPLVLLALAAGLHQGIGNEDSHEGFAALSTHLPEVQQEIVNKHNELRRQVDPSGSNILKMEWNGTAAANAQRWAESCTYEHSRMSHRRIEGGMECGENIFYSTYVNTWSEAIQEWMDESKYFIFKQGPSPEGAMVGHYTQLVWYRSFLLGCGVAYCSDERYPYLTVCHYCPAGNLDRQIYEPYKEGKPCGSCPDSCDKGLCTNPCTKDNPFSNCDSLKARYSCKYSVLQTMCPASCLCGNKIY